MSIGTRGIKIDLDRKLSADHNGKHLKWVVLGISAQRKHEKTLRVCVCVLGVFGEFRCAEQKHKWRIAFQLLVLLYSLLCVLVSAYVPFLRCTQCAKEWPALWKQKIITIVRKIVSTSSLLLIPLYYRYYYYNHYYYASLLMTLFFTIIVLRRRIL